MGSADLLMIQLVQLDSLVVMRLKARDHFVIRIEELGGKAAKHEHDAESANTSSASVPPLMSPTRVTYSASLWP